MYLIETPSATTVCLERWRGCAWLRVYAAARQEVLHPLISDKSCDEQVNVGLNY